ncbi:MAG: glycosyltransferase family 2 protein [Acidimicrobiia bacterium]
MNPLRRHLHREISRVIDGMADAKSRITISVGDSTDDSSVERLVIRSTDGDLVPAERLAEQLTSDSVRQARTVVLDGALNRVDDVYLGLANVASRWSEHTRLVNVSYNRLWRPLVRGARSLGGAGTKENWIPPAELDNLIEQSGFEVVERRTAVLVPIPVPVLSRLLNRWLAPLPVLRLFCVFNIVLARPREARRATNPKVSVVIAARNEAGNIAPLMKRLPQLSPQQEVVFVEGGSTDDTWGEIQRAVAEQHPTNSVVKAFKQTGKGKGDAVRLGFAEATGDILIILDADLSVPPEELPRFIDLLRSNACEFANGSRLVYPMEQQAMQFLNLIGNRFFGVAFSFLLGQPVRDTLCGTKALWATDYRRIAAQRSHFGDFDPFGDFDLLFGAARLHLRIRDVPVHYKERVYGSTNISRFWHGALLLRMTLVAARKLRFV